MVGGLLLLGTTLSSAAAEPEVCVADEETRCLGAVEVELIEDDAPAMPTLVETITVAPAADAPAAAATTPRIPLPMDTDVPTPGGSRGLPAPMLPAPPARIVPAPDTDIPTPGSNRLLPHPVIVPASGNEPAKTIQVPLPQRAPSRPGYPTP